MKTKFSGLEKALGIVFMCASILGCFAAFMLLLGGVGAEKPFANIGVGLLLGGAYALGIGPSVVLCRQPDPANPSERRRSVKFSLIFACVALIPSVVLSTIIFIETFNIVTICAYGFLNLVYLGQIAVIALSAILTAKYNSNRDDTALRPVFYGAPAFNTENTPQNPLFDNDHQMTPKGNVQPNHQLDYAGEGGCADEGSYCGEQSFIPPCAPDIDVTTTTETEHPKNDAPKKD